MPETARSRHPACSACAPAHGARPGWLGAGDALRAVLEEAGFIQVRVERVDTVLRHRSLDDACDAALVAGPVALAWSRFGAAQRDAVRTEYAESIRPFITDGGSAIPAQFVVATGRKQ